MNTFDEPAYPGGKYTYPSMRELGPGQHAQIMTGSGLTKLEFLAGMAMQGMLANEKALTGQTLKPSDYVDAAALAVDFATALLLELNKGPSKNAMAIYAKK